MGMDIGLLAINSKGEIFGGDISLSRRFCDLMARREFIHQQGKSELDQISLITDTNLQPIYDMWCYDYDNSALESLLSIADSEEEKQALIQEYRTKKDKINANIAQVELTIDGLIQQLMKIPNLANLIEKPADYEHPIPDEYFFNFSTDTGDGYLDNNFGQDLRNFRRFLEYAKEHGGKTVFLYYE
jgi:hypothetical protein